MTAELPLVEFSGGLQRGCDFYGDDLMARPDTNYAYRKGESADAE